jgi:hypothetical protein
MKTPLVLLLALPLCASASESVVIDSANTRVTVTTSDKGVAVLDPNYGTHGSYFIGMKPGRMPFVTIPGGFAIADPALAAAIDNRTTPVKINFVSTIVINNLQLPVNIVFRQLPGVKKTN